MIQSEDEQKEKVIILPPLKRLGKQKTILRVNDMLYLINKRKGQYQQQISKQQPNDNEHDLKYLRCQTDNSNMANRQFIDEEMLARGNIIQSPYFPKTPKRHKLVNISFSSSRQPSKRLSFYKRQQSPNTVKIQNIKQNINQQEYSNKQEFRIPKKASSKQQISQQTQTYKYNEFLPRFNQNRMLKQQIRSKTQQRQQSSQSNYLDLIPTQKAQDMYKFIQNAIEIKNGIKTNELLDRTVRCLESFNPFFRKLQRTIGVCLLRIGKIKQKNPENIIYQVGNLYNYFYIILSGKAKLYGKNNMRKICETGEILLEQILSEASIKNKHQQILSNEKAKAITEVWLLQINRNDLQKLEKELIKYGFKQGLAQMKTLIKRNQIVKNWLRNKFKLISNP